MVDLPGTVECLYTARVEEDSGRVTIEVPRRELELGTLEPGRTYSVALIDTRDDAGAGGSDAAGDAGARSGSRESNATRDPGDARSRGSGSNPGADSGSDGSGGSGSDVPRPPVREGEQRVVSVEAIGDQGDGIAKVERGYVVIVPDADVGEQVRVEIEHVTENVAFASLVE